MPNTCVTNGRFDIGAELKHEFEVGSGNRNIALESTHYAVSVVLNIEGKYNVSNIYCVA